MEVFVMLSFRWLNLEGFYAYTIPQKKALTRLQGLFLYFRGVPNLRLIRCRAPLSFWPLWRGGLLLWRF
ncbi:MAG: hypothetical protein GDA51_13860 [Ekhidna sp.]|nr:hypothetical protein [Ekhidna sp.]